MKPNPGSQEAIDKGCTCPVMDNNYGKGFAGNPDQFWYSGGCPLHDPFKKVRPKKQV